MLTVTLLRAAIWDMDGTLIDSGELHWLAWSAAMEREGRPISRAEFAATFGQRNDTILRGYFGESFSDSDVARVSDAKERHYRQLVREQGIVLLPGVADWLAWLQEAGWRQAIATAAPRANAEAILEVLGIAHFFAGIAAAEDVQRGKPDPQVFLMAAEHVGVEPARCVVLEDAPAGLEGARRAGMRCIGVRTNHQHLEADVVVDWLSDLPADTFTRLIP